MRLDITHTTTYAYAGDVSFSPHYLRFRPRDSAHLQCRSFSLSLRPAPDGQREVLDEEGNTVVMAWWSVLAKALTVTAESVVELADGFNPLAFILHPVSANRLPLTYAEPQASRLGAALAQVATSPELDAYVVEVIAANDADTVSSLLALTRDIHADFEVAYREWGPPLAPADTFAQKRGSCRDLSWMLIAALRQNGLAARFCSGYFYFEMAEAAYELHAWVEVFLPGPGWVGLDPSHGIAIGTGHIPLAASAHPAQTMPVTGGVAGDADMSFAAELTIRKT